MTACQTHQTRTPAVLPQKKGLPHLGEGMYPIRASKEQSVEMCAPPSCAEGATDALGIADGASLSARLELSMGERAAPSPAPTFSRLQCKRVFLAGRYCSAPFCQVCICAVSTV